MRWLKNWVESKFLIFFMLPMNACIYIIYRCLHADLCCECLIFSIYVSCFPRPSDTPGRSISTSTPTCCVWHRLDPSTNWRLVRPVFILSHQNGWKNVPGSWSGSMKRLISCLLLQQLGHRHPPSNRHHKHLLPRRRQKLCHRNLTRFWKKKTMPTFSNTVSFTLLDLNKSLNLKSSLVNWFDGIGEPLSGKCIHLSHTWSYTSHRVIL